MSKKKDTAEKESLEISIIMMHQAEKLEKADLESLEE